MVTWWRVAFLHSATQCFVTITHRCIAVVKIQYSVVHCIIVIITVNRIWKKQHTPGKW